MNKYSSSSSFDRLHYFIYNKLIEMILITYRNKSSYIRAIGITITLIFKFEIPKTPFNNNHLHAL